jgi:hypothetical protein
LCLSSVFTVRGPHPRSCVYHPSNSEIDNICFIALPRHLRERIKEAGRVLLTEDQAHVMARSRIVHVCAIVLAVMVVVSTRACCVQFTMGLPVAAFIVGGVSEAFKQGATAASIAREAAKVVVLAMLAQVGWFGALLVLLR